VECLQIELTSLS